MKEQGIFCEIYGNTIRNRVLEYLLENQDIDFAIGDMAKELGISRPKAYDVIKYFEDKKTVRKSRIIGKTRLYTLNKEDMIVKLFLKNFKDCLKMVIETHAEAKTEGTEKYTVSLPRAQAVSDKKTRYSSKHL